MEAATKQVTDRSSALRKPIGSLTMPGSPSPSNLKSLVAVMPPPKATGVQKPKVVFTQQDTEGYHGGPIWSASALKRLFSTHVLLGLFTKSHSGSSAGGLIWPAYGYRAQEVINMSELLANTPSLRQFIIQELLHTSPPALWKHWRGLMQRLMYLRALDLRAW